MGSNQSGYYGNFDNLTTQTYDVSSLDFSNVDFSTLPTVPAPPPPPPPMTQEEIDRQLYEQGIILSTNVLGRAPTQTEINQAYGDDSPFYQATFADRLKADGQYNLYGHIAPNKKLDSFIRFLDGSTWYYSDIAYADEFRQAGYNVGLRNGAWFALMPGQSVEAALEVEPDYSIDRPIYDNVLDAAINKGPEEPIKTTLESNVKWEGNPPPPTIWNPPQFEPDDDEPAADPIDYSPYLMLGAVVFAVWALTGKKKN